jgi:SAM-dependent methyltransferase
MDSATAPAQPLPAAEAYDALAPFYDRYTADYEHEEVLAQIEALALDHGLVGRRLLDVACGTGKSFLPLRARGYDVRACDVSAGMVDLARGKLPPREAGRVEVADMRSLPWREAFDLVTCLDDAVNYLLGEEDLELALGAIAGALRPGGLAVFDVNTLRTYREAFAGESVVRVGEEVFVWRGEGDGWPAPGDVSSAVIDVWDAQGRRLASSRHVQRHRPRPEIEAACAAAGLECRAVRGVAPGGALVPGPDEEVHRKLVFVAAKSRDATGPARRGGVT